MLGRQVGRPEFLKHFMVFVALLFSLGWLSSPLAAAEPFIQGIQDYQVFSSSGYDSPIPFRVDGYGTLEVEVLFQENETALAVQAFEVLRAGPMDRMVRSGDVLRTGRQDLSINGITVGGPYILRATLNGETCEFRNLYMGEVWIVGGGANALGSPAIHQYDTDGPVHVLEGGRWQRAVAPRIPEHMPGDWSSPRIVPWLRVAERYHQRTGRPIGLVYYVKPSWSLFDMDGRPSMESEAFLDLIRENTQGASTLLWWHGESEAIRGDVGTFLPRLKTFVRVLREETHSPEMTAGIVQIGRDGAGEAALVTRFAGVRELQRQFVLNDPYAFMVPALPYETREDVYVGERGMREIALRIAGALLHVYKKREVVWQGPRPVAARFLDPSRRRVVVDFDNTRRMLADGDLSTEFEVTDASHRGRPTLVSARVDEGALVVHVFGGDLGAVPANAPSGQAVRVPLRNSGFIRVLSGSAQGRQITLDLTQPAGRDASLWYGMGPDAHGVVRGQEGEYLPAFALLPIGDPE